MNQLLNLDCLEFLTKVEPNSIDYINVDPPYSIGFDGGRGWDSQWKNEREYLDWCYLWTKECIRILKPNRMFSVWGTLKTDTFLKYKLEILNSFREMFPQNEIIWSYNWGGRSKENFARKHEYCWNYSKGSEFLFNADNILQERKLKKNPRTGLAFEKGTIPTCIWEKNNHTTSQDFINWHPTTKNLDVLERMVLAYSNSNDLVLDCFSGSGSIPIVCLRNNRKYLCSEKDLDYFTRSSDRINKEIKQLN